MNGGDSKDPVGGSTLVEALKTQATALDKILHRPQDALRRHRLRAGRDDHHPAEEPVATASTRSTARSCWTSSTPSTTTWAAPAPRS
ncbi:hypothetical protein ACRAWF_27840 [Streptomyces sp. L7]